MLESRKQQERGRKVAQDSTLQGKSRKADAKWLKQFGLSQKRLNEPRGSVVSSSPFLPSDALSKDGTPRTPESPLMRLKMTGYNFSRKMTVGLTERSVKLSGLLTERSGKKPLLKEKETAAAEGASPMPARPTSRDSSPMPNRQSERTPDRASDQGSPTLEKLEKTADDILIELLNVCIGQGGFDGESDYDLRMRRLTKRFCHMRRPSLETFENAWEDDIEAESRPARATLISSVPNVKNTSLQIPQGRVYAVVGRGKAEMLRLLGKVSHPSDGEVFVPPHLSIEHVEQTPTFFRRLSLYENLLVRVPRESWPDIESVVDVATMLGMRPQVIDFLRQSECDVMQFEADNMRSPRMLVQDPEVAAKLPLLGEQSSGEMEVAQSWELQLSTSEKQALQLAMALLADPNLLVLHQPLRTFESEQAEKIRGVIKRYVSNCGIGDVLRGQPGVLARTVVFSCSVSDTASLGICDGIILMGRPHNSATLFDANMLLENRALVVGEDEEEDKRSRGERLSEQVAQLLPRHMLTRSNTSTNLNTARKLNASSPPKHSQHSCSSAKAAAKEDSPSFSVRHSAIARYSSSDGENVGRVLDMV